VKPSPEFSTIYSVPPPGLASRRPRPGLALLQWRGPAGVKRHDIGAHIMPPRMSAAVQHEEEDSQWLANQEAEQEWRDVQQFVVEPTLEKIKSILDDLDQRDDGSFTDVCRALMRAHDMPFREWIDKEKLKAIDRERRRRQPRPKQLAPTTRRRLLALCKELGDDDRKVATALNREGFRNTRGQLWKTDAVRKQRLK
jgi:hypothetical protein